MIKEDLFLIVGYVFIKASKAVPNAKGKKTLADEIIKRSPSNNKNLSSRTLVNYYNYFLLNKGKEQNPDDDTLLILINYWSGNSYTSLVQAIRNFKKNKPEKDFIQNNIPLFDNKEKEDQSKVKKEKEDDQIINNITINNLPKEDNKIKSYTRFFYVTVIAIVGMVIVGFYFFNQKGDTSINIDKFETNNDFRQINPTKETQFFSKEDDKPLVWYANYNNGVDYFNGSGKHPITGKRLQPITKEIVRTRFLERIPLKENQEKKTDITVPIQKNKNNSSSISKEPILTSKGNKVSIFIFDSIAKIDDYFVGKLQNQLKDKYSITSQLITDNDLSKDVIDKLKKGNISFLQSKLKNKADYVCVGTVDYSFKKGTMLKNRVVCDVNITYSIISLSDGIIVDSYSNIIVGNGTSKIDAKNNTINKFAL